MRRWYETLRASSNVDIVLFDTPPALVVADSPVLASTIEAPIILVVQSKGTRRGAAQAIRQQLEQIGVELTGVVLNAVNPRDKQYSYGYGYYYYYYNADSSRDKAETTARQSHQT
jgi:Mrp family chromosome partitioning ATPase